MDEKTAKHKVGILETCSWLFGLCLALKSLGLANDILENPMIEVQGIYRFDRIKKLNQRGNFVLQKSRNLMYSIT